MEIQVYIQGLLFESVLNKTNANEILQVHRPSKALCCDVGNVWCLHKFYTSLVITYLFYSWFFFGEKKNIIKRKRIMIREDGRIRDPSYKSRNKQKKNYQWSVAFQSLNMSKWKNPLKRSWALHQKKAKHLTRSHKICFIENLSLKMRQLHTDQTLQTVTYVAHCLKDLAFFLLPKPAKLVNKNWSKVAGHTQHSPKIPNKVFYKKSATGQCKNKYDTDSEFTPHITHT